LQKTSAPIVEAPSSTAAPFEPVPRPRVLERIRRAARRRIVLVVAPAGFGKSVAVRQFLEADGIHHLRFSVRKEHATLVSFLRGLVGALEPIAPKASKSVAGAYEKASRGGKTVEHLAAWVTAMLSSYIGTIFIDDLHLAEERAAIALISEVIDQTGEGIKWIIATRSDLSLPHASWLAYGARDESVDEADLTMSPSEALLASKAYGVAVNSEELSQLLTLTGGWPVALTFALRASARAADLQLAAASTREISYNYLADQVFQRLSVIERSFLLKTCLFARIDTRILAQLPGQFQTCINDLRGQATFLVSEGSGTYRYHDLFRDFLEHELRSAGMAKYHQAVDETGAALLGAGYYDQALALHLSSGSRTSVRQLLLEFGWQILEAGAFDRVAPALEIVGAKACGQSPILLGLLARIEESRGNFEGSDAHYARALEIAIDDEATARITEKWSASLLNRFMLDRAYRVISRLNISRLSDSGLGARLWALRSGIEVRLGRSDEAVRSLKAALLGPFDQYDEVTRAIVWHFAAYVYLWLGRIQDSSQFALKSLELSRDLGMFDLCGRTCSILFEASGALDDQGQLEWSLNEIAKLASLSGDPLLLQYALFCRYDLAVEQGNFQGATLLEQAVDKERALYEERWAQTVLAADAMRAACSGDFRRAFSIGSPWRLETLPLAMRALRASELALYASAANLTDVMEEELTLAKELAAKVLRTRTESATVRVHKTIALLSIALVLQGRALEGQGLIDQLNRGKIRGSGVWSLTASCKAICKWALGTGDVGEFAESIKKLRKSRFAGYATLLEMLPIWRGAAGRFDSLTSTELKILRFLKEGHSSKEIAARLDRSHLTVDTHVKSILRKLQCGSRREAVAMLNDGTG
jgi:DNA-binding CsgD family transcriptional regulator/tetratricopeptide (TPR) repeat protein